jgi:hypothetical protein
MKLKFVQLRAGLLLLPVVASAHHSFAMFDTRSAKTVQGTVRAFEFSYPHSWLWIDVPDGKGGVEPWGFESASPTELNRVAGWTRATVKKGDKVSVTYCPLRDGRHGGAFVNVLLPDGRKIAGTANECIREHPKK